MTVRYERFQPGAFNWCVDRVDLGDPVVSQIVRVVCRHNSVWPEQLLGRRFAGAAVSPSSYPLSTGPCEEPCRERRIVFARRLVWRGVFERTDWSVENIALMIGGYSPSTVGPWARSWRLFERDDPEWWEHWGPAYVDLLGCEMPEEYLERLAA